MRRRAAWILAAALLIVLVAVRETRDALLFRNALGADLPFYLYTVTAWAPLVWLQWRVRSGDGGPHTRIRRNLAIFPAALYSVIFLELWLDPHLTRALGLDFTWVFARAEGGFYPGLQDALRAPGIGLDYAATYLYAYGYVAVYGLVPAWIVIRAPLPAVHAVMVSLLLAWVVGIASFLFFPVNEPWTTDDAITNVLFERIATAQDHFLLQWAINNEFPSMHVATTFAVATPLWFHDRRRLAWMMPVVATMPIVVVYLGIHWVSDAVAGVLLGVASGVLANRPRIAQIALRLAAKD